MEVIDCQSSQQSDQRALGQWSGETDIMSAFGCLKICNCIASFFVVS
jgi:hypothetical protein